MYKTKKLSFFIALFLFALILNPLSAQIPDWTKTDSDGTSWNLHSILKSDKAVLLDFFATWSTFCNSAAPVLQKIWEDCGKGNNKFYLFAMDIDNTETDQIINNFKSTHSADFPAFKQSYNEFIYYDNLYGSQAIPFFVLIIPDTANPSNSTVAYTQVGWTGSVDSLIRNTLDTYGYGCVITGEEHLTAPDTYSVYPNPANDYFVLRSGSHSPFDLELFNVTGQKIFSHEGKPDANQEVQINISSLPEEMYLARVHQQEKGQVTSYRLNVIR